MGTVSQAGLLSLSKAQQASLVGLDSLLESELVSLSELLEELKVRFKAGWGGFLEIYPTSQMMSDSWVSPLAAPLVELPG